jgi:hypothetical protein
MPVGDLLVSRVAREGRTTYILLLSIAFLVTVSMLILNKFALPNDMPNDTVCRSAFAGNFVSPECRLALFVSPFCGRLWPLYHPSLPSAVVSASPQALLSTAESSAM